jgi:nucleotide-binding universal stress UspA family protein
MYARIVVPLDGSELAEVALPHAEDLARTLQVPLHLVRVVDFTRLEQYGPYGLAIEYAGMQEVLETENRTAREYLQQVEQRLSAGGLRVTSEFRQGSAARELVAVAQSDDLIVMATHGRSGVTRWFLGSVAEDVVRRAAAPVLIVRANPTDDQSTEAGSR